MREGECAQPIVAPGAMGQLLPCPGKKAVALQVEERLQFERRAVDAEHGLFLAADVEIDQRHGQFAQVARLAQQPAVDLRLRPVQLPMIVRLAGQIAAKGLDLFEPVRLGIVTVGAAAHQQLVPAARQTDFGFMVCGAAQCHQLVTGDAFLRRRRRREAQVEVAFFCGEFAQAANSHGIGHERRPCRHRETKLTM